MRILVVEDEKKVASFLRRGLEAEHHEVDVAHDGDAGLARALATDYDLIILDVMLPRRDGLEVVRELRRQGRRMPILVLTARATLPDKVTGLDVGADDYLTKPFEFAEFLARVRALLRRGAPANPPTLAVSNLTLDPVTRKVVRGGRPVELTPREFALLEFFMRNPGRVFPAEALLERVWPVNSEASPEAVRTVIKTLRRKIDHDSEHSAIRTIHGVGYKLELPDKK